MEEETQKDKEEEEEEEVEEEEKDEGRRRKRKDYIWEAKKAYKMEDKPKQDTRRVGTRGKVGDGWSP